VSSRRRRPANVGVRVHPAASPVADPGGAAPVAAAADPSRSPADPSTSEAGKSARRPYAALMVAFAVVGIIAAGYLTWVKLAGGVPVCGPIRGCETVQESSYSELFGVPIAVFGLGMSSVILVAAIGWWRSGDRRLLYVPYALGLLGLFTVAYLTFLEIFVIHAICVWCVTFGASVVLGWIVSAVAVARAPGTA